MSGLWWAAGTALLAALAWGSGDFTSGLIARRAGSLRAVLWGYTFGLVVLVGMALLRGEPLTSPADLLWGALAGLLGMLGLGFLLKGFATGRMGVVAPVSAVLSAMLPVAFHALTREWPGPLQLVGFGVALVGIWLLSRPERFGRRPEGLGLAILAGLGFGSFFILLDQISADAQFWPLVAGRLATVAAMLLFGWATRRTLAFPNVPIWMVGLAGTLDVAGNFFFLLATQTGRLDVAAVLASLYPAVTALLARWLAHEHLARMQLIGLVTAVLAIVLITLPV